MHIGEKKIRPPLTAVCKYLRSFVTPIYLAGNTFSDGYALSGPRNCGTVEKGIKNFTALARIWGDDFKHMRSVCRRASVPIRWVNKKKWREDRVVITTSVKLFDGGEPVLKRHSSKTMESGFMPRGGICRCELEAAVAAMGPGARDIRRLWEIAGLCQPERRHWADVEICGECQLHRLVLVEDSFLSTRPPPRRA